MALYIGTYIPMCVCLLEGHLDSIYVFFCFPVCRRFGKTNSTTGKTLVSFNEDLSESLHALVSFCPSSSCLPALMSRWRWHAVDVHGIFIIFKHRKTVISANTWKKNAAHSVSRWRTARKVLSSPLFTIMVKGDSELFAQCKFFLLLLLFSWHS